MLTKTERHDALALLVGFTSQVETQKALRRVHKALKDQAEVQRNKRIAVARDIAELLGEPDCDDGRILELLNDVFATHGVPVAGSLDALGPSVELLAGVLAKDNNAVQLSSAETLAL